MLETRNNEKSFEFLSETENSNTGENFWFAKLEFFMKTNQ